MLVPLKEVFEMKLGVNYLSESMYIRKPPSKIEKDLKTMKNCGFEAIRLTGDKLSWLLQIAKLAKREGFEIWLCPRFANYLPMLSSIQYLTKIKEFAIAAEKENIDVFLIGNEVSLELRDFADIQGYENRCGSNWPIFLQQFREERRSKLFTSYLSFLAEGIRKYFSGKISYAAGSWELNSIDWYYFDILGANLYLWEQFPEKRYTETVQRLKSYGKPVAITEFGFTTTQEAWSIGPRHIYGIRRMSSWIMNFLMSYPELLQKILRINPKILLKSKIPHHYDEETQAALISKNLKILDKCKVDYAFVFQWFEPWPAGFGVIRSNGTPKKALKFLQNYNF